MWFALVGAVAAAARKTPVYHKAGSFIELRPGERMEYLSLPQQTTKDKCPCCGSWEFREHRGSLVCSYCRNGLVTIVPDKQQLFYLDEHRKFILSIYN